MNATKNTNVPEKKKYYKVTIFGARKRYRVEMNLKNRLLINFKFFLYFLKFSSSKLQTKSNKGLKSCYLDLLGVYIDALYCN